MTDIKAVARFVGLAMILPSIGYILIGNGGIAIGAIIVGTVLFLSNLGS